MGDWKCENCELSRPHLDFATSQIQLDGINQSVFTILDNSSRQEISSSMPGLHNVYNALAAFSAASELGIDHGGIASSISQTVAAFGRTEKVAFVIEKYTFCLPRTLQEQMRTSILFFYTQVRFIYAYY